MFENLTLGPLFVCTPVYTVSKQKQAAMEQLCIPVGYLKRDDFPADNEVFTNICHNFPAAEGVLITIFYPVMEIN